MPDEVVSDGLRMVVFGFSKYERGDHGSIAMANDLSNLLAHCRVDISSTFETILSCLVISSID